MNFELTVYGTPAPAGSKRAFAVKSGGQYTGKTIVTDDSKRSKPWKQDIKQQAGELMLGKDLMAGPLLFEVTFYMKRPQGHYGTGKNSNVLKRSAPVFPEVKPDVLKLARAVEDALSGIVYRDDAQLVTENLAKRYDTPERVEIKIRPAIEVIDLMGALKTSLAELEPRREVANG